MSVSSLISTSDIKWSNLLKKIDHNFYQTSFYTEIEAKLNNCIPKGIYFEADDLQVIVPVMLNSLEVDWKKYKFDAKCPYGYPGIISNREINKNEYEKFIFSLQNLMKDQGILTLLSHLQPFNNEYLEKYVSPGRLDVALLRHGPIVNVPLGNSIENIRSMFSTNHRRNIRKLIKLGYYVKFNEWGKWQDFKNLYESTMSRLSATDYYYFSDEYWDYLHLVFQKKGMLCLVYDNDDKISSGGLFTVGNNASFYHLGGTHSADLKFAPSKLMFFEIIEHLQNMNCKNLILGGGLGLKKDNLFKFKAGFSDVKLTFMSLALAADKQDYIDYSHHTKGELKGNPGLIKSFFPYYRL